MKFIKYKKIIIAVCVVAVAATSLPPKPAQALFPDWVNAGIQIIGHGIQGALLGVDSAFNGIQAGLDTVRNVVNGLPIQYGPVRQGLSVAMASCDLLGGNLSAVSEIDALTAPSSPSYDPELLDDRLVLPNPPPVDGLPTTTTTNSSPSNNGTVAADNTTYIGEKLSTTYKEKIIAENSTVSGTKTLETPKITSKTNLDPLANQLSTIGDKTKTNLTLLLTKKLGLQRYQKTCYKVLDSSLKNSLIIASWNDQLKQAYEDTLKEMAVRKSTVDRNVAGLEEQLTTAQHEVMTALTASLAADINEQRTLDTLSELKPKLTVGNYNQTVDALTKQVYAPKMIKEKYTNDLTTQFILGSLLNAEIATDSYAKQQADQTAQYAAQSALRDSGACPEVYDYYGNYDMSTMVEASNAMTPGCDEVQNMDSYRSKFSEIMAESKQAALTEVNTGGGWMSTRLCKPADKDLKQQLTIAAEAAKKVKDALLTRQQFEKNSQMRDPAYITAINSQKQAVVNMHELTNQLNSGVDESCGPIDDTASLTKNLMEQYVGQWITGSHVDEANPNQSIKDYDEKPLKLFGKYLLASTEPRSVVSMLKKDGQDFLKALLTGQVVEKPKDPTPLSTYRTQILGDVTEDTQISEAVPVVPYTSPRGDFGINRGGH